MEKIVLKSSQISDTLARSVSELRAGADLIDVTLVSGDGKQFDAHDSNTLVHWWEQGFWEVKQFPKTYV